MTACAPAPKGNDHDQEVTAESTCEELRRTRLAVKIPDLGGEAPDEKILVESGELTPEKVKAALRQAAAAAKDNREASAKLVEPESGIFRTRRHKKK